MYYNILSFYVRVKFRVGVEINLGSDWLGLKDGVGFVRFMSALDRVGVKVDPNLGSLS